MAKIKSPNTKKMPNLNWLISPSIDHEEYRALSFDTRVTIARKQLPWFNPPHDKKAEGTYDAAWWKKILNGCHKWSDERSVAVHVSLFPERTRKEYEDSPKWAPVEFYAPVTRDNAYSWYMSLPDHLRRGVDKELATRPAGGEIKGGELYDRVFGMWGDRPELPDEPKDAIDGLGIDEFFRVEVWREWVRTYEELLLVDVVMAMARGMQEDRKMLSSALGLSVSLASLPNLAVGIGDDVSAATIRWLQSSGATPLEFLAATYRDDNAKVGDRIAAARTLMEYVHKRVPQKQEIETKEITEPRLSRDALKGLSDKDLETLEALLSKLGKV